MTEPGLEQHVTTKSCGHDGEKVLTTLRFEWETGEAEEKMLFCVECMLTIGRAFNEARGEEARKKLASRTLRTETVWSTEPTVRPKGADHLPMRIQKARAS